MPDFPMPPDQNQDPNQNSNPDPNSQDTGPIPSPLNIPPPPSDFTLDSSTPPNTIESSPSPQEASPPPSPGSPTPFSDQTPPFQDNTNPNSTPPPPPAFPTSTPPSSSMPPADPPPPPPQETPTPATTPKKSPFKFLIPIILGLVILAVIAFVVIKFVLPGSSNQASSETTPTSPNTKTTTITYYGLWEPPEVMRVVLDEFERQNPSIKVDYQMQQSADYRERLQTLLTQKDPPDVIRFHSTWIPQLISHLKPAPENIITPTEIDANFYPAVKDLVVISNQVYAVPATLEGLGLYVNQEIFNSAQESVPTTWVDLRTVAKRLTQIDPNTGQISRAGIALGTTSNVDHWPDIVSLMLLQNGVSMSSLTPTNRVSEVLRYYTFFTKTDAVWSNNLPSSVQAFAAGKAAMILAPSWQAITIKELNPSLSWKIYPVPQLPDAPVVTWVNYWVEGVPKNASHPNEAWKLVKFLSSSQAQQLLFDTATKQRGFGQAPANKALASTIATNPIVGPFVTQAATAKTFYTTSLTHDGTTGINSRLNKYLEDAINSHLSGANEASAVTTLQQGFYQVLSQYNLVSITPTPAK